MSIILASSKAAIDLLETEIPEDPQEPKPVIPKYPMTEEGAKLIRSLLAKEIKKDKVQSDCHNLTLMAGRRMDV